MNVKLLRKVKRHILAEPKRFVMSDWINRKAENNPVVSYETDDGHINKRSFARCGTAACLAGWTLLLSKKHEDDVNSFEQEAGKLLGLNEVQTDRLFYSCEWPGKFQTVDLDTGKKEAAKVAAARIEHFIKTKGRE